MEKTLRLNLNVANQCLLSATQRRRYRPLLRSIDHKKHFFSGFASVLPVTKYRTPPVCSKKLGLCDCEVIVDCPPGQVADDHFVYYEMLFDDRSVWEMPAKWLRFYYDVAGLEGIEWWVLTPLGLIALFLVFFPMVLVVDSFRGRASLGKERLAEHQTTKDQY